MVKENPRSIYVTQGLEGVRRGISVRYGVVERSTNTHLALAWEYLYPEAQVEVKEA